MRACVRAHVRVLNESSFITTPSRLQQCPVAFLLNKGEKALTNGKLKGRESTA